MSELDAIRARHVRDEYEEWCKTCDDNWPCDTVQVLAALDTVEVTAARAERLEAIAAAARTFCIIDRDQGAAGYTYGEYVDAREALARAALTDQEEAPNV